jgi:hypothetical protein
MRFVCAYFYIATISHLHLLLEPLPHRKKILLILPFVCLFNY